MKIETIQTGGTLVSSSVPDRSKHKWKKAYSRLFQSKESRIKVPVKGSVFIPVLLVMRAVMGMNGIIYAQAVADYVTIILSAITLFYTSRKYLTGNKN